MPGWLVVVIVVLVVAGVIMFFLPKVRQWIRAFMHNQVAFGVGQIFGVSWRPPRKAVQLFGGNLASQLLYTMVLGATLHAYGESLPLLQLVLVNCVTSFIGGMAPVPGGMGVIETGLIAGFTASGIPEAQAVAATLTADVHVVPAADLGLVSAVVAPEEGIRVTRALHVCAHSRTLRDAVSMHSRFH